jgi:hypothetical protein
MPDHQSQRLSYGDLGDLGAATPASGLLLPAPSRQGAPISFDSAAEVTACWREIQLTIMKLCMPFAWVLRR